MKTTCKMGPRCQDRSYLQVHVEISSNLGDLSALFNHMNPIIIVLHNLTIVRAHNTLYLNVIRWLTALTASYHYTISNPFQHSM